MAQTRNSRKYYYANLENRKPFKNKVKGRRLTIVLVPDLSPNASVKRISIPYPALGLILLPVLCIIAIVMLFQTRVTDLETHVDSNESQARDYSTRLSEVIDENRRLEETLAATEGLLEQSRSEAAAIYSRFNDIDNRMAQLLAKAENIDRSKRNILEVFDELQGLDIPFDFDEGALAGSDEGAVGGAYIDDTGATLAIMDIFMSNNMLDYTELERFAEDVSAYIKARPVGNPVPGSTFRDGYGYRTSPLTGEIEFHQGIDIAAIEGAGIYATADGVVSFSGMNRSGFGYLVTIEHAYGYSTYYAHNSRLEVKAGEAVSRGQLIALMGDTGDATGVHCHYEVRRNGIPQDPRLYMRNAPG